MHCCRYKPGSYGSRGIAGRLGVTYPAANDAVSELVALDILRPDTQQRRHRVFKTHEVMNALYTGLDAVIGGVSQYHIQAVRI